MAEEFDLQGIAQEILRSQTDARFAGDSVPNTDQAQAIPVLSTDAGEIGSAVRVSLQADYAEQGDTGPAFRGTPNDFGWRHQNRMEIGAYSESYVGVQIEAGGVLELNPNRATVYWVNALGSLSVRIADISDPGSVSGFAPTPIRCVSFVIVLNRSGGATVTWPDGTQWSKDVRDPNGDGSAADSLLNAPSVSSRDVFVLLHFPGLATIGFLSGKDFA
jgi:hypothetical protein